MIYVHVIPCMGKHIREHFASMRCITVRICQALEVDFLPPDKHKSFLQYSGTLGVCSQSCSKYPKQQVSNVFAISQRNCEG